MKHCLHVYHGEGKGKTTAAIGAAVRAAGRGIPVCFAQFMKGGETGEIRILSGIPEVTVLRPRRPYPFFKNMTEADKAEIYEEHQRIFREIQAFMTERSAPASSAEPAEAAGEKDPEEENRISALIVMDELLHAMFHHLMDENGVREWVKAKPAEIIVTGRYLTDELVCHADYLTEMIAERHPYEEGLSAMIGVEL